MKGHFYYSRKQDEAYRTIFPRTHNVTLCKLDNGDIVEYSEMTDLDRPKPDFQWSDMKYLGTGIVYSIDGVLQSI